LPVARILSLTAAANSLLKQFEVELEPLLAEDGELGAMADWAGKLAGAIVRIAGILHLSEHAQNLEPWPKFVSPETMSHAIAIGRYLIPHAKAAYAEMGADPQVENAKRVLRWIVRTQQTSFSKRDAHQAHKTRFKKVSEIESPLELLEAHGYVREREIDGERRRGRKSSQTFDVNPFLFSNSHNPHNSQNYQANYSSEDSEDSEVRDSEPPSPVVLHQAEQTAGERERVRI
jgi:replicative DNA helicase